MIWCDDLVCDVFNEISIDTLHVFLISFDSTTISHVKMRKLAILLIYKTKYLNNDRNKKMIENIAHMGVAFTNIYLIDFTSQNVIYSSITSGAMLQEKRKQGG